MIRLLNLMHNACPFSKVQHNYVDLNDFDF